MSAKIALFGTFAPCYLCLVAINQPNYPVSVPLSPAPPKTRPAKRKRGGQTGNHNACKHGLYAAILNAADMAEFSQDVIARGIVPDIALVRARLRSVLLHAPSNRRALDDAAGILAKMYSDKLLLDKTNIRLLKRVFCALLESCSLVADCEKQKSVSRNESGVP